MPQYWLRAFAEDGHVLGRWRGGAEHRTPVRRAAVARHFNTDPLAEGERRVALETYLDRHVDGPAAPVLHRPREGLTRKIAAKANAGAAAWCQDAVYRLPSMSWPAHLRLASTPLEVRPPRLSAVPAQRSPGPAPAHPEISGGELRAILEQLSRVPADQPPVSGTGGGR